MKYTGFLALAVAFTVVLAGCDKKKDVVEQVKAESMVLDSFNTQASYLIGTQIGNSLKSEVVAKINLKAVLKGLIDAYADAPKLLLNEKQIDSISALYEEKYYAQQEKEQQASMAGNEVTGQEFAAKFMQTEGAQKTMTGLIYRVDKEGSGPKPTTNDRVKVYYKGSFTDGKVFDQTQEGSPAVFNVTGVIPGWVEGLQLMSKGAKFTFVIPANLAYGERGNQGIPPGSTLVFEVELLDILPGK